MKCPLVVVVAAMLSIAMPALAEGGTRRFAVIVGANDGGPLRPTLRHAGDDARAYAGVLTEFGGVEPADLELVTNASRHDFEAALASFDARLNDANNDGLRTELFVYYSGHADEDGLLLRDSRLRYAALRHDLEQLHATVRIVVLDSCQSGAIVRGKGGQKRAPFLAATGTSDLRGHAFLTSSAADEQSQESDRLGGSFFTHALVAGLRGAGDQSGDGTITLGEAYVFAFADTLSRTEATLAGPQHASYEIALQGAGEFVMTDLRNAQATLTLPSSLLGIVTIRDAAGRLAADVHKQSLVAMAVALVPGRYQVTHVRGGNNSQARRGFVDVAGAMNLEVQQLPLMDVEDATLRGSMPMATLPINLALVTPIETNAFSPRPHNILAIAVGYATAAKLSGVAISGGGVHIAERAAGMMLAGGYNRTDDLFGAQITAGLNVVDGDALGAQLGLVNLGGQRLRGGAVGLVNLHSDVTGVQSSLFGLARDVAGLQLSLINVGGVVQGAQVGLINIADTATAQIGLINLANEVVAPVGLVSVSQHGQWHVGAELGDIGPFVYARAGSRWLWSSLALGTEVARSLSLPSPAAKIQLGGTLSVLPSLAIEPFVEFGTTPRVKTSSLWWFAGGVAMAWSPLDDHRHGLVRAGVGVRASSDILSSWLPSITTPIGVVAPMGFIAIEW